MIHLSPTDAAMVKLSPSEQRVWIRRLDVSEIVDLPVLGQPSEINRRLWTKTTQQRERSGGSYTPAWYGGKGPAELREMLVNGYAEGSAQASELARTIEREMPDPVSRKRRLVWNDGGDEVDRDRIYGGKLESAWRSTRRKMSKAPQILSIAVPWGDNCGTGMESFWSAAAAIALTDLLEKASYSVELRALNFSRHYNSDGHFTAIEIMVKHPSEPLRPDAVAAALHIGSFRHFGIPAMAGTPYEVNDGFGYASPVTDGIVMLTAAKLADPAHIIIERTYDARTAKLSVLDALEALESGNLALLDDN